MDHEIHFEPNIWNIKQVSTLLWYHLVGWNTLLSTTGDSTLLYSCIKNALAHRMQFSKPSQIARFLGPTRDPPGSCRPQLGPMLAPWTLLSAISGPHVGPMNLAIRDVIHCRLKYCCKSDALYSDRLDSSECLEAFATFFSLCAAFEWCIDSYTTESIKYNHLIAYKHFLSILFSDTLQVTYTKTQFDKYRHLLKWCIYGQLLNKVLYFL